MKCCNPCCNNNIFKLHGSLKAGTSKKNKYNLLFVLCQNQLFDDTAVNVDDLSNILSLSNSSIRNLLKELDKENYIIKIKYGKKIGYSANLVKFDELP